jgi:hypothetical protein
VDLKLCENAKRSSMRNIIIVEMGPDPRVILMHRFRSLESKNLNYCGLENQRSSLTKRNIDNVCVIG